MTEGEEKVVVRDRRRLDPETGEVREPAAPAEGQPAAAEPAAELAPAGEPDRVAELTETLQRLQAEYSNYRKRVDRDRLAVAEAATASLLVGLLPLLDDVERARQHGDLEGAFKSVGEGLEQVAEKLGLERYGEAGEPFDPAVHEALMQAEPQEGLEGPVCAQVLQVGYRVGGRVLRPARVSVADPV